MPAWLGARDVPWLRELLHDSRSFVGRPFGELLARWRQSDPDPRAGAGGPIAHHVLRHWLQPVGDQRPRQWRRELFAAIAAGEDRDRALAAVAARAGCAPAQLRAALFDDLPARRLVVWQEPRPTPLDVAHAGNRCQAATLLQRAESFELELLGGSRTVLRTAWLHGAELVTASADLERVQLRWQRSPLAPAPPRLRAFAALLPVLPWTRQFVLRARCRWRGELGTFVLDSTTALLPGPAPRPFDSALERDLAAACAVLAPELELVREPAPLPRGDQLAFPDFLVRRRGGTAVAWLEIAGGRMPTSLAGKLVLLAHEPRYVLCAPRRLALPEHPRLVPFGRRIDAKAVLRAVRSLP